MENFDSDEELQFYWYLMELKNEGLITDVKYHPQVFSLSNKILHVYDKPLKTKSKEIEVTLLSEHRYQADFYFFWTESLNGRFYSSINSRFSLNYPFITNQSQKSGRYFSIVDVKGTFNQNDAYRRFSIDQKWVYQRYGLYVQKIIPVHLFKNTFTPKRYLFTDKSMKPRKLNYKPLTLNQYLESINK